MSIDSAEISTNYMFKNEMYIKSINDDEQHYESS